MSRAANSYGLRSDLGGETDSFKGSSGHTLIELLLALLIVGICAALPALSVTRALARLQAGTAAHVWESGARAAQLQAIWGGSPADVIVGQHGFEVVSPGFGRTVAPAGSLGGTPFANVSRWRSDGAVTVSFLPGFGSPDAAGSLFFGTEGAGRRVVLRVESGLTRTAPW